MLQYLVSGAATGALYGVIAVGIVLIYRASGVINFAHGEIATICTFTVWAVWDAGVPLGAAIAVGLVLAGAIGPGVEGLVISRLRNKSHINEIMATVALFLALNGLTLELFGHDQRRFPPLVHGAPIEVFDTVITRQALLAIVFTTVLAAAFAIFFRRTSVGIAMRAISENRESAELVGLPVPWIVRGAWLAAAVLGTISGVLVAPIVFLNVDMMIGLLIKAFAGAVLGGLTSIFGALVGAVALGIGESLISGYVSSQLSTPFTFFVLVVALVVRPHGLFGRAAEVKL
ncbi:MAG: branched-chain amino acid ABC transporter permease [Acidimicrobiales bacterium]|nr:branched-chain amino acid ABC transporter permease [Acidimicrobiales bacterium]